MIWVWRISAFDNSSRKISLREKCEESTFRLQEPVTSKAYFYFQVCPLTAACCETERYSKSNLSEGFHTRAHQLLVSASHPALSAAVFFFSRTIYSSILPWYPGSEVGLRPQHTLLIWKSKRCLNILAPVTWTNHKVMGSKIFYYIKSPSFSHRWVNISKSDHLAL